ncbi:MAG: MOSC domain-containing protein [Actinomycetota bacterium]|nr:MOSC domain-containing protein [Actinomycetota bacterium]
MDGLLDLSAVYDGSTPVVGFPDGRKLRGDSPDLDAALSEHVGRAVVLGREAAVSHFDEGPLHLVTSASCDTLARAHGHEVDARRTRANLVLACEGHGFPELGWVGRRLRLGTDVVVLVRDVMPRCVMLNAAQDGLPADPSLLRTVTDVAAGALGVVADVERGGRVTVGDAAVLA